jgi:hypothetical protein
MLVLGARAKKKRPELNTTSLWFITGRAAERKLRGDRKKNPKKKNQGVSVWIGVEKSASHHLSHTEIVGDNPCS